MVRQGQTASFNFNERKARKKETLKERKKQKTLEEKQQRKKTTTGTGQISSTIGSTTKRAVQTYQPNFNYKDLGDDDDDDVVDVKINIERFCKFFERKRRQPDKEVEKKDTDEIKRELETKEILEADACFGVGKDLFTCKNPKCKN